MQVKFKGGKELEAALKELGNKATAKRAATRALDLAAVPIRDRWIQLAPEDEGDLKHSIKIGKAVKALGINSKGDVVVRFVGIDESLDRRLHIYAGVQEYGNESNPAQPAGRPAFEEKKMESFNMLGDLLWQEIKVASDRAARKTARLAGKK